MMRLECCEDRGISRVEEVLGSQYAGDVIRFFKNLMLSDYDYVVLLSRRCFVLYRLFSRLLGTDGEQPGRPRVVTDKAVALWSPSAKLWGKSCLIVDDILIHGRAVSRVYESLRGIFGELRIYVCGKSMNCYEGLPKDAAEELLAITFSERVETASSWRLLSDRLVSLIHLYNEPYTSFLMSMRTSGCPDVAAFASELEEGVPGWEMHRCYHEQSEDDAANAVVMFEDQLAGFFSKYCEQACVRIYCRPGSGSLCITPTVFPKTVPAQNLDTFMQALVNDLPSSMEAVKALLGRDTGDRTQSFDDLRYRLASSVLSALYGAYALPSLRRAGLDLPDDLEDDLAPLEYSFSPDVAKCVNAQLHIDHRRFFSEPEDGAFVMFFHEVGHEVTFQETPELVDSLQGCLKARPGGGEEAWKGFLDYFFLNGIKDERTLLESEDVRRDIGLSTPNMVTIAQDAGLPKNISYVNLISAWDTGRASMDALMLRTGDGNGYYSTFNCAGERSYKTVNDYLGYHVVNMQRIEDFVLCWYGLQGPSYTQERYDSTLSRVLGEYCRLAKQSFSWPAAVWGTIKRFIDFLVKEKVPVSDYVLDPQEDDGEGEANGYDEGIAEFGKSFMKRLISQGV